MTSCHPLGDFWGFADEDQRGLGYLGRDSAMLVDVELAHENQTMRTYCLWSRTVMFMESQTLALRNSVSQTAACSCVACKHIFGLRFFKRTPDTSVVHHAIVQ